MPDFALSPAAAADDLKGRGYAVGLDRASAALGGAAFLPVDLRALTAEAFGYSALRRYQTPPDPTQQGNGGQYGSAQGTGPSTAGAKNMFGLPTFVQVNFGAVPGSSSRAAFYGLTLLDPLVTVSRPATVVKTTIQGRNGTVKEYIGQGDLGVVIRGILATPLSAADRFAYPLPDVRGLQQLVGLGAAIPVSGFLQDVFDIKNLVIENIRYEALPGFVNLQAYEIEAVSDDPVELAL